MTPRVRPLPLAVAAAALALTVFRTADAASTAADPAIAWTSCAAEFVDATFIDALGDRLECGVMKAPLSEAEALPRLIDVGVVRIRAGKPAARQGSLFFNFGGPGGNPLSFLPLYGYVWSETPDDDSPAAYRRRIADRYDLVAVIPRGMHGGERFTCKDPYPYFMHDPAVRRSDDDFLQFIESGTAFAHGCGGENGMPASAGTLGHVRDMERARVALGESRMNFLGISYGTWVGAFYAATYPQHTGRMVLDSSMNYAGTIEQQFDDQPAERSDLFRRLALLPATSTPAYGLGCDPDAVMRRLGDMPPLAREAWATSITTPAQLAAALTMADWIGDEASVTAADLIERAGVHHFSEEADVDDEIRKAAIELAPTIRPKPTSFIDWNVYYSVICGDTPWQRDLRGLRTLANEIGTTRPEASGEGISAALACRAWPNPTQWRPLLSSLSEAQPLLLVQAEFDPATPLKLARKAFEASHDAYMVTARGMFGHGVFGMSETPCIEASVGDYLLDGKLPTSHDTQCDFVPTVRATEEGRSDERDAVRMAQDELRRMLRHS